MKLLYAFTFDNNANFQSSKIAGISVGTWAVPCLFGRIFFGLLQLRAACKVMHLENFSLFVLPIMLCDIVVMMSAVVALFGIYFCKRKLLLPVIISSVIHSLLVAPAIASAIYFIALSEYIMTSVMFITILTVNTFSIYIFYSYFILIRSCGTSLKLRENELITDLKYHRSRNTRKNK